MRFPSGPEPVAEPEKLRLVNRRQELVHDCLLEDLVLQCGHPKRSCPSVRLGDVHPPNGRRSVRAPVHAAMQVQQSLFQLRPILLPPYPVDSRRSILPQSEVGAAQGLHSDMVQQRGQSLLGVSRDRSPYPVHRLGHAPPTLRPARALAHRIPLGSIPSLHRLRRGSPLFVRPLHRYYG